MTNGYKLKNRNIKGKIKLILENMYVYVKSGL